VSELKTEFGKAKSADIVPFLVKRGTGGFVVVKVTDDVLPRPASAGPVCFRQAACSNAEVERAR
jgi:hypothetical protein